MTYTDHSAQRRFKLNTPIVYMVAKDTQRECGQPFQKSPHFGPFTLKCNPRVFKLKQGLQLLESLLFSSVENVSVNDRRNRSKSYAFLKHTSVRENIARCKLKIQNKKRIVKCELKSSEKMSELQDVKSESWEKSLIKIRICIYLFHDENKLNMLTANPNKIPFVNSYLCCCLYRGFMCGSRQRGNSLSSGTETQSNIWDLTLL